MLGSSFEHEGEQVEYEMRHRGHVFNVQIAGEPMYKDDLTGQLLDPRLVQEARAKELEYFEAKQVWKLKPIDWP